VGVDLAGWLASHPYLARIAAFEATVRGAAAEAVSGGEAVPAHPGAWARANASGRPALQDGELRARVVDAAGAALGTLLPRLASAPLPAPIGEMVAFLAAAVVAQPSEAPATVEALLDGAATPGSDEGLVRHLGWSVLARVLAPGIQAFEAIPDVDERRWARPTCPTCGALPVNALLVARREGRERQLACGLCRTRWGYRRIGCVHCGNDAPSRLDAFEIDGEPMLRLDTCGDCKGYVKTVKDERAPSFLADDWTTVHVDVLATGKGFRRLGASLYEIPSAG
jgi:FdhE protein